MSLKGKTFREWENGQNIYEFEKEIDPEDILTLFLGYIHVFDHYSQAKFISIYPRSQVRVYMTIGSLEFTHCALC